MWVRRVWKQGGDSDRQIHARVQYLNQQTINLQTDINHIISSLQLYSKITILSKHNFSQKLFCHLYPCVKWICGRERVYQANL